MHTGAKISPKEPLPYLHSVFGFWRETGANGKKALTLLINHYKVGEGKSYTCKKKTPGLPGVHFEANYSCPIPSSCFQEEW